MTETKGTSKIAYLLLKTAKFFGLDFVAENKQLQDENLELKKKVLDLEQKISENKSSHISERQLPPNFRREHNNLLVSPDGTKYCWNCYNKVNGGELRVLDGNEYNVSCKVCGIFTKLKEYTPPPTVPYNPFRLMTFFLPLKLLS